MYGAVMPRIPVALAAAMVIAAPASAADREELTAKVVKETLPIEVELSGVFVAEDKDEISVEPKRYRGDLIVTTLLDEGTHVAKGDVLMEFDRESIDRSLDEANDEVTDATVELKKAEADLEAFKVDRDTTLLRLKKELAIAERDLKAAKEKADVDLKKKDQEIVSAENRVKDAEVDFEQLIQLYEERELHTATENILIEREKRGVEDAKRGLREKIAEVEHYKKYEAMKDVETKELEVDKKGAELKKTEIQYGGDEAEKQAAVTKAKRKLDKAKDKVTELDGDAGTLKVVSPRDGVVFYGRTGNDLPAGIVFYGRNNEMRVGGRVRTHEILMTVAAMDNLAIKMRVLENDIQHMKPGLPITVFPDAFPNLELKGELTKVDQIASRDGFMSEVREFTVKGSYEGVFEELRSGMNCRVAVHADSVPDAVQVPVVAIFEEGGEHFCYVREAGSRSAKRPVKIGATNGKVVEITEGLQPDEVVYLYDPNRGA